MQIKKNRHKPASYQDETYKPDYNLVNVILQYNTQQIIV